MKKLFNKPVIYIITILIADQLTKYLVRKNFYLGESLSLTPFFQLTYLTNTGVAFSFFQGANSFFVFFTFFVLLIIYLWYRKNKNGLSPSLRLSIILVVSGAMGNLIDRIIFSQITDFLDFNLGSYHWPAFNIADSCISVGGTLLFLNILKLSKKQEQDTI